MTTGRPAIGVRPALLAAAAALVVLLSASAAGAVAVASASINAVSDDRTDAALAAASALTTGPGAVGAAAAEADVARGTLRARTDGTTAAGPGGFLDADASAQIEEVLFVVPDPGSPATPVPFAILMDLRGTLDLGGVGQPASSNLQSASARASASLAISGFAVTGTSPASFTVQRLAQASLGVVQADDTTVLLQQNTAGLVDLGVFDVHLAASATVTPNSAFTVRAVVSAESGAEAGFTSAADLFDTGQLGVVVPEGYSLLSSSGLFLTVPEPRGAALAAGAALLAMAGSKCFTRSREQRR